MAKPTTPDKVFDSIVAEMIARVERATCANCYLTDDSTNCSPLASDIGYLIEPGKQWGFDAGFFGGAGRNGIVAEWPVTVAVWALPPSSDEPGRVRDYLFHDCDQLGVLELLHTDVMGALANNRLLQEDGSQLLMQGMRPDGGSWSKAGTSGRNGWAAIQFNCQFNWLMTGTGCAVSALS